MEMISVIPTWEQLRRCDVGTEIKYKDITIKRYLNNIKVTYKKSNKEISIICFSKEQYELEIKIMKKI